MNEAPLFSVLMPAYNAAATLEDAVRSVMTQDHDGWELLIVDDGSTDETLRIAQALASEDPRICVLSQPNAGAASARNTAAARARGSYLAMLDADDLYLPDYLGAMAAFIEAHRGYGLYSCAGRWRFPGGRELRAPREARPTRVMSYTLGDVMWTNRIFGIAVVSAEAFAAVGGFRDVYVEDYDLWLRLLAAGHRHLYLPADLAVYRVTPGSKTVQRTRIVESIIGVIEDLAGAGLSGQDEARRRASLERLEHTLELARLEARLAAGDFRGARAAYVRHVSGAPTRASRVAGALAMAVSPKAYLRLMSAIRGGAAS